MTGIGSSHAPRARQFLIGPSDDGLWIVCDDAGQCGALFKAREDALHFAKSECEAAGLSKWRFVAALDLGAVLARREAEAQPNRPERNLSIVRIAPRNSASPLKRPT